MAETKAPIQSTAGAVAMRNDKGKLCSNFCFFNYWVCDTQYLLLLLILLNLKNEKNSYVLKNWFYGNEAYLNKT